FIVEVALGMIAKGVPQLNVFIESFPIRIMVGLFLISVISAFLVEIIVGLFGDLHEHLLNLLQLFAV
ncbi:MAG TPA: flagellar biosynthetic protein FliR, partial [Sumerlaeia bacterium]|nr:flagellar biosynthetic protein FliR [Sumerlaeia bacterium]